MQWNNFTQIVFIFYIFICPLQVSMSDKLTLVNLNLLLVFDMTFMLDRIMDLFVGYYNPNG